MIKKLRVLRAEGVYPYRNQAIERYLLESCEREEMILYLWANDKTVFIGKNQNAYTECRLSLLRSCGGFLARRFTGGGAVYHDRGNLNFTFLVRREDYSIPNQFEIMTDAMRSLGLNAQLNGRNDVLIDGKKFSGNAFYKSEGPCLHHGTILIRSDTESIEKYLSVSSVKLNAKGVKSVKSRVGNLSDFRPDLNADMVADSLVSSLKKRYPCANFEELSERSLDGEKLSMLEKHFSDESYILGDNVAYESKIEARFSWGVADIRLQLNGNKIERARIYSDSLDCETVEEKEALLTGYTFGEEPDPRIKDIIEEFGEQV